MSTNFMQWMLLLTISAAFRDFARALKTKQLVAGETLRLRCTAANSNENVGNVGWSVPGNISNERYEVTASTSDDNGIPWIYQRNIELSSVTVDDTGFYTCFHKRKTKHNSTVVENPSVDNFLLSKTNWIKRVYVYVYDPSTLLLKSEKSLCVEPSEDLILPCKASHEKADVVIERVPYENLNWTRIIHVRTLGFVVMGMTNYDNGFWKCKATYNGKTESRLIMVNVEKCKAIEDPLGAIEVFAEPLNVPQNHPAQITCRIFIKRRVRVAFKWQNFPQNIVPGGKGKIEYGYGDRIEDSFSYENTKHVKIAWSKITLFNTTENDTGVYNCKVTYGDVEKMQATRLFVYDAPHFDVISQPQPNCGQSLCVAKGRRTDLSFKIKAMPKPSYVWYNGSEKLIYDDEKKNTRWGVLGSEFWIQETTIFDTGNYTLEIIAEGNRTRYITVHLLVKEPQAPKILRSASSSKVMEKFSTPGKDVKLHCNATGIPLPNITWYHENKQLQEKSPTLILSRIKWEDEGFYTCVVDNDYGSDEYRLKLTITKPFNSIHIAAISIIFVMLLMLFAISWLYAKRKRKLKELKRKLKLQQMHLVPIIDPNEMALEEQAQTLSYDPKKWEFPRDRLRFGKILGRGAFGKVVQATAFDLEKSSSCKTVAVKMLKVGSRTSEFNALMSELKILIHLGPHLNIVNLLGACTAKDGPLMILVEYCRHGNLSVYLRGMRDCYVGSIIGNEKGQDDDTKKNRCHSDNSADDGAFLDNADERSWTEKRASCTSSESDADAFGSNECNETGPGTTPRKCYDSAMSTRKDSESSEENEKEKKEKDLSLSDLLSFSLQVSRGMEFLASKKCIHRDLAARNVLLSDYQVVKICDFGLARDVYKDPDYVRSGDARLPLKWMAPESIFDKVYTTKSDVWSFGVLLWEIFTLGGSPYPGLQIDEDFCHKLRRGVRMSKPRYATDPVYSAMLACWANLPEERPDFTKLCEELSDVLQAEAGHEYLDLLKIFDADVEGKLPLRGVKPQQIPIETFEVNLTATPQKKISVTYTDVEMGVLHKLASKTSSTSPTDEEALINEVQESCDIVIESTQESISFDQLGINAGYLSEDSGVVGEKQSSLVEKCSVASPSEPPPLYDDVIALRSKSVA